MIRTGTAGILPAGTADFVRRRLMEAAGGLLLLAAVALFATLASFDPADPSWNHATDATPRNVFGAGGARLADLLLHLFGMAALLLVLWPAAWGWRLACKQRLSRPLLRALALGLTLIIVSILFAVSPSLFTWPLLAGPGGLSGSAVAAALQRLQMTTAQASTLAIGGACMAVLSFAYGIGVSFAELRRIARAPRRLARLAVSVRDRTSDGLDRLLSVKPLAGFSGASAADPVSEPGAAASPAAPHGGAPVAITRPAVVTAKAARVKGRKGEATVQQGRFDFEAEPDRRLPGLELLREITVTDAGEAVPRSALEQNALMLKTVLDDFGVRGEIVKVRPGPVITLYELEPAPGIKSARVIGLADDIARSMSAVAARVAVIPGRNVIGIELPNHRRETVGLRDLLASEAFATAGGALNLALGKDIGGMPVISDLARMPHLLIAGTTGSGKSVGINAMILSLLYRLSPEECKFILIDPKMLELSVYDGIPHLLAPVVTEPGKAVVALKWTVREMEERYRAMSQLSVRNIAGYNARIAEARRTGERLARRVQTGYGDDGQPVFEEQWLDLTPLPLIVVVVDEMADLMLVAGKEIETAVQRLSQMARAAGIHLIMATQRPSVDVITGTIKANFPTRVSFQVSSKIDSRTILGEPGAEQLLGQGDMLFMAGGGRVTRVHGPFVSDGEVEAVVQFLKAQGAPQYLDEVTEDADEAGPVAAGDDDEHDDLYAEAVDMVRREGKVSTSFIQRRLQIGYNRAARMVERMEAEGLVSRADRVGRREVLGGDDSR